MGATRNSCYQECRILHYELFHPLHFLRYSLSQVTFDEILALKNFMNNQNY